MIFQAFETRDRHFLDFLNDDLHSIESLYTKGDLQVKYFRHSNSLYVRATRAIINHTSIGEYYFYLFSKENFNCLCRNYLIKSRHYILHNCRRFNNYWNLRQDTISHFVSFLVFNKNIFSFGESIIQQSDSCLCNINYTCFPLFFFSFVFFFFYMLFASI